MSESRESTKEAPAEPASEAVIDLFEALKKALAKPGRKRKRPSRAEEPGR